MLCIVFQSETSQFQYCNSWVRPNLYKTVFQFDVIGLPWGIWKALALNAQRKEYEAKSVIYCWSNYSLDGYQHGISLFGVNNNTFIQQHGDVARAFVLEHRVIALSMISWIQLRKVLNF